MDKQNKLKMQEEELVDVVGGFKECTPGIASSDKEIVCPNCGRSKREDFDPRVWVDEKLNSAEYHCNCGCKFICYDNNVILKSDWIGLCEEKNVVYKHAGV